MEMMTKEIEKRLEKAPIYSKDGHGKDALVECKFFHPVGGWTWYVLEGEKQPNGDWYMFGYVDSEFPEYGYFTLSELENVVGPFGLKIERDMYFKPCKLGELVDRVVY